MRLDFNVLWVDDQPDRVASQGESIAKKMALEGFDFKPRQCTTIDQMEEAIAESVFTDEVDLILVDWDLGNNTRGEDAITRIREIVQYKDIVFYSGEKTAAELRQKAYEKQLEGVYCAGRQDLVEEVIGVFDSLIKKVLDLDHTRGIVMGATSDIDHMVNTCINLAHSKLDDDGRSKIIEEALRRIEKQVSQLSRLGEKIKSAPSLEAIFKAHMLFTSDHRLRLLEKVLSMSEFSAYATRVETITTYRDGVVQSRNILGHVVLAPQGKPSAVMNGTGKTVDLDEMRKLRKLILELRTDFRALLNDMQA